MYYLNQLRNPIWNFDATGSILKNIKNQKRPYIYSIVSYDPKNRINIPFCEWFSTCHTQSSISQFLFTIKNILLKYASLSKKSLMFKYAPIIVTDFSFALLNSILSVFNCETRRKSDGDKHEMLIYLDIAFETLVSKKTDRFDTISVLIYICSTHFLYNFIKKVRKIAQPVEKRKENGSDIEFEIVKRFGIFCFSLLINSTTLEEFLIYLKNIYFIFMEKVQSSTFAMSIYYIRKQIAERNIKFEVRMDIPPKERQRDKEFFELKNKNNLEFQKPNRKSIKFNSPFSDYFNKIILDFSAILQKDIRFKPENPFYLPELFQLIQNQLYLAPVWSGIFISEHFRKNKEFYTQSFYTKALPKKLENNRVENRFDNLKNDVLPSNQVTPSEYSKATFSLLKSQYIDPNNDFINRQAELSKQLTNLDTYDKNNNLVKKVQVEFSEPKEKWDGAKGRKRLKKNGGTYFDNVTNAGIIIGERNTKQAELEQITANDFFLDQFDVLIDICKGIKKIIFFYLFKFQ